MVVGDAPFFQYVILRLCLHRAEAKDSTQRQSICGIKDGGMCRGPAWAGQRRWRGTGLYQPIAPRRACSPPSHPRNGGGVTHGKWYKLNSSQVRKGDDCNWPCQAVPRWVSSGSRSGSAGKHIAADVSEIGEAWHQADEMW